jgi:hypothetical protein
MQRSVTNCTTKFEGIGSKKWRGEKYNQTFWRKCTSGSLKWPDFAGTIKNFHIYKWEYLKQF